MRSPDGERGSIAAFTVLFSIAVLILAGLLVDGGGAINARLRAADIAEQAARAGADSIDVDHLRETGQVRLLDDGQACDKAAAILGQHADPSAALQSCAVGGGGQEVTVSVTLRWQAYFLTIIGFGGGTMRATATAGPRTGLG
ncbi:membrane protein [Sphaerisporangium rufum]|uniref:Membrane protein n=1 Tax=Sphaerisporangium rufum TaxID=1381558 RepID=A0A919UX65_9ACTN|nr:flp pilus-assembly TadE/G-like family protein [Sphaerisporangium rufum]GII75509.1 membrane protein [Sphaerisporangium rufum]